MDNPRNIPATRTILEFTYAVLLADEQQFEEAARYAGSAWQRSRKELGFGLYQCHYLIRAGRLDQAAEVLARVEAEYARTGLRGDDLERLRATYREARASSSAASDRSVAPSTTASKPTVSRAP